MDAVHLHLLITHVPVLATIFSFLILIWGVAKPEKHYYQLAMVGFIIAALLSIVAVQSGEGAEETAEELPGVTETVIHNHEEAAEITNWIAIILGVASIGGFYIMKNKAESMKNYLKILLLLGLVSSGAFIYTAYLGGQVRHTEIRPDDNTELQDTELPSTENMEEDQD
jgi:uncharacterized membrane protein